MTAWYCVVFGIDNGLLMNRIAIRLALVAAALFVASAGTAWAADMATKAPPQPAGAPSWTGFYVGANGGWGWSNVAVSEIPFGVTGIADISPQSLGTGLNGGVFGGQLGYNWQTGNWVAGVEGDFDGAGINGVSQVVFPSILGGPGTTHTSGFMARENVGWLASIRGRLGTTWGPGLAYVTGGGAWENITTTAMISANTAAGVFGQSATGNFSTTQSGFVVGAGYEWAIDPKWTVRAEYLYYGFHGGSTNAINIASCAVPGCGVNETTGHNDISVVRLGVNYKFNSTR
jgi:outer membrane immunogenic protein